MRRALYVLLSTLLFLVLSPLLLLARKTRRGRLERFGFYRPDVLPEGGGPRVWLHGASAGDLLALSPMIGRLRERFPDARIILSTMTNTGYLMAERAAARTRSTRSCSTRRGTSPAPPGARCGPSGRTCWCWSTRRSGRT